MQEMVKRQVALTPKEYELAKRLSAGIGFSGYAADAIRARMASDVVRARNLKEALRTVAD